MMTVRANGDAAVGWNGCVNSEPSMFLDRGARFLSGKGRLVVAFMFFILGGFFHCISDTMKWLRRPWLVLQAGRHAGAGETRSNGLGSFVKGRPDETLSASRHMDES